ncbi:MAG: pilin [Patescibacteria group bacterium]
MSKINIVKGAVSLFAFLPVLVFAQSGLLQGETGTFGQLIEALVNLVNNFLIPLAIAFAVLVFIWGVIQYFILGGGDDEKRAQGRNLMLYAIIGFVAIVALWSLVNIIAGAFGVEVGTGPLDAPQGPDVGN